MRLVATATVTLALAGGCGWNSSCGGFYVVEGPTCGDAGRPSEPVVYGPCLSWSGGCPRGHCLRSNVAEAAGEELCTVSCRTDADCGRVLGAPGVCAGDGSDRLCHRACPAGGACGGSERCVSAAASSGPRTVCVPRGRVYRPCVLGDATCRSGLSCVPTVSRGGSPGGLCTQVGCTTNSDCPEHDFGIAVCLADPGDPARRRCEHRCRSDSDCVGYRTVCTAADEDAGAGVCVLP